MGTSPDLLLLSGLVYTRMRTELSVTASEKITDILLINPRLFLLHHTNVFRR